MDGIGNGDCSKLLKLQAGCRQAERSKGDLYDLSRDTRRGGKVSMNYALQSSLVNQKSLYSSAYRKVYFDIRPSKSDFFFYYILRGNTFYALQNTLDIDRPKRWV